MGLYARYATQAKINEWSIMAIKGYMPLKFQSVALPNGIVANLFGPVEGRCHDARMLNDSGVRAALQQVAYCPGGDLLCIYEDRAYPLRPQLMGPYKVGDVQVLTPEMMAFNKAMSRCAYQGVAIWGYFQLF